eukprot:78696-Prymnesium_polylepis.1
MGWGENGKSKRLVARHLGWPWARVVSRKFRWGSRRRGVKCSLAKRYAVRSAPLYAGGACDGSAERRVRSYAGTVTCAVRPRALRGNRQGGPGTRAGRECRGAGDRTAKSLDQKSGVEDCRFIWRPPDDADGRYVPYVQGWGERSPG